MTATEFRVESNHPISGRLVPVAQSRQLLFADRAIAVAIAMALRRSSGTSPRMASG
jgi:hypothetical protein